MRRARAERLVVRGQTLRKDASRARAGRATRVQDLPAVSESEKIHASVAGGDAVDERDGRMRALVADHRSDSCRTSEDVVHGANPFLESSNPEYKMGRF